MINNIEENFHFDQILAHAMDERGMNAVQLASLTGLSSGAISRYLAGDRQPTVYSIQQIAKALGVSADYLVGIDPVLAPPKKSGDPEEIILLNAFSKVSDDDRAVLWALLRKYMTPHDRALLEALNQDNGSGAV